MAEWRNIVKIKKYFTNDESNDNVLRIVNLLIPQLERIVNREYKVLESGKLVDAAHENLEYYISQLEEVIDEFKWIQEEINKGTDPNYYEFDTWTEAFNEYLTVLYDLADEVVKYAENRVEDEKFIWIS